MDFASVDEQLCYALHRASRAMTGCYRLILEDVRLTYPQYMVMLALWEHETLTVGQLAHILELGSGTLSPLLKRLHARGLVLRRRRAADERSVEVTLTEDGVALRRQARLIQDRVFAALGLDLESIFALRDTLNALSERLSSPSPVGSDA